MENSGLKNTDNNDYHRMIKILFIIFLPFDGILSLRQNLYILTSYLQSQPQPQPQNCYLGKFVNLK